MDARLEDPVAAGMAAQSDEAAGSRHQTLWWRLASIALFCGAWEIAGLVPINLAFPTFSSTVAAFFEMVGDGTMLKAYALTLQPLIIGLIVSTVLGVSIGVAMGLRKSVEWMAAPIFIVLQAAPVAAAGRFVRSNGHAGRNGILEARIHSDAPIPYCVPTLASALFSGSKVQKSSTFSVFGSPSIWPARA